MKRNVKSQVLSDLQEARKNGMFTGVLLTASLFMPYYIAGVAIILVAFRVILNYQKRAGVLAIPYSKLLLSIPFMMLLMALAAKNKLGILCAVLAFFILVAGLYFRSIMTRAMFNRIMDTACICSLASLLVALIQKWMHYAQNPEFRPFSTFLNANYYAATTTFVVLIAIYRIYSQKQNRPFYLAVIGANLLGLYLSGSMSSAVALCCGIMTILLLKEQYKYVIIFIAMVISGVFIMDMLPQFFPRIETLDHVFGLRGDIWETAIRGILRDPLIGEGAMSYSLIYGQFGGYQTYHAHNLYLDMLLNYGIFGTSMIVFYCVTQGRILWNRIRSHCCQNMSILLVGMLVTIMVHGCTDVTIFWIQTAMLFLLVFSSVGIQPAERRLHVGVLGVPRYLHQQPSSETVYFKN